MTKVEKKIEKNGSGQDIWEGWGAGEKERGGERIEDREAGKERRK